MPRKLTVGMQYKRGGLRNAENEFSFMMPRPCPRAGHERTKPRGEDTWWTRAGKERAHSGQIGHMADTWWTHARQTQEADNVWRRGQNGHVADKRRSHGGHMADKIWRQTPGGHKWQARFGGGPKRTQGKAGTWRTKCGDAAKAESRRTQGGHLREPTVNCLGNDAKETHFLNRRVPTCLWVRTVPAFNLAADHHFTFYSAGRPKMSSW